MRMYIVSEDVVPDVIRQVVRAREDVADGMSISSVCELYNISRTAYYKYRDKCFLAKGSYDINISVNLLDYMRSGRLGKEVLKRD